MSTTTAPEFRPEDPAFVADPFPAYRRLRDEDPAHWSPRLRAWVLTRYDDCRRVLLDKQISSDRLRPFFAAMPAEESARIATIIRYLSHWMVFRDPPDHTRLRRLTSKVFNLQSMTAMRPRIEAISHSLLDALDRRNEIDFVADFAGPLPALVIMAMLGVPAEELARVRRLSDEMALFIGSSRTSAEKYAVAERATGAMAHFFRELIAERRAAPREDLISGLVALGAETAGDDAPLSDDEIVASCILLLFAGHETTTNHIANGLLSLLEFPEQLEALRAEPALAAAAVEELLRYDGPSGAQVRIVTHDGEMHGRRLARGERVFLMLNAANRDERAYADPDRVDLQRDGPAHLTFGFGMHICLGFPLARLEGQIALPAVLARWHTIALAIERNRIEWLNSMVFRGMKTLPLRVTKPG
jgi:cytochrome P450